MHLFHTPVGNLVEFAFRAALDLGFGILSESDGKWTTIALLHCHRI